MTQNPVQALKEFLIPCPEYSPDHFSSMFPLRLCLAQAPQLLPFALLEQEVHWQKKLVATTSPAKQHGQHKPSLENTMPCRQRLYVMLGYLPSGSSVKSPSWGSWAARVQTGRVHKQLLQPLSREWTAASCCLSGCLDSSRPGLPEPFSGKAAKQLNLWVLGYGSFMGEKIGFCVREGLI